MNLLAFGPSIKITVTSISHCILAVIKEGIRPSCTYPLWNVYASWSKSICISVYEDSKTPNLQQYYNNCTCIIIAHAHVYSMQIIVLSIIAIIMCTIIITNRNCFHRRKISENAVRKWVRCNF